MRLGNRLLLCRWPPHPHDPGQLLISLSARSGKVTGIEALKNVIEMEEVAAIEERRGAGDLNIVERARLDSGLVWERQFWGGAVRRLC